MASRPVHAAVLALGCAALQETLAWRAPADLTLRRFFREHPHLGRNDRAFIAETLFAILRRLRYFTAVAGGRDPRRLFIAGANRLPPPDHRDLTKAVSVDESRWLAALDYAPSAARPAEVQADLPDWLIERLRATLTQAQVLAIGKAMQAQAPLDLRVNTLLASRDEVLIALRASGIEAQPTRYSPFGLRVAGKPAIEKHPLYLGGRFEVQDEGSQLLGLLLAPRRRAMVVDFCAGAGGKTLLLGQLMRSEGLLYALDVSEQRLVKLRRRLARSGLSNVHPELIAHENDTRIKRLSGKIDRVLADVPCTGTGTLRRNPDLKWRLAPADLEGLRAKQTSILAAAARLPKAGGRLMYATCSVLPEENDAIVDEFLAFHPEYVELDCGRMLRDAGAAIDCGARLRLLPHLHGTDGFFAALLERRPDRLKPGADAADIADGVCLRAVQ